MHETVFVNEIFSVLKARFSKDAINSVVSVNVRLSPFSHVTQEGLLSTYQELAEGSGFGRIKLNIAPLSLLLYCRSCKNTSTVSSSTFKCPRCSNQDIELNFNKEFIIESVEINRKG